MALALRMNVLVLNAGSSSLKFDLWDSSDPRENRDRVLLRGEAERVESMEKALDGVFAQLQGHNVEAVGHRVVHGGERYTSSVLIDAAVEQAIGELSALAPLHNPHNLEGIRAARAKLPSVPHVAVFDTAFHHTLPPHAYVYALPWEYLTEDKVRRYGFHGISHRYVSWRFAALHGKKRADYRLITCHLGNGCSVCAIDRGQSVDTSMGFTPLEGLVMGTRSGDVDAGAILHLITQRGIAPDTLLHVLNGASGLKGLSGVSNDMRDVLAASAKGDARASVAVETFCYRVRKYIGAYLAAMNGADALIFTGGIGENSAEIRARICANLNALGVSVDAPANSAESREDRRIGNSKVEVWVVPTDEELLIARDTYRCIHGIPHD
jgi:acetate kinase